MIHHGFKSGSDHFSARLTVIYDIETKQFAVYHTLSAATRAIGMKSPIVVSRAIDAQEPYLLKGRYIASDNIEFVPLDDYSAYKENTKRTRTRRLRAEQNPNYGKRKFGAAQHKKENDQSRRYQKRKWRCSKVNIKSKYDECEII